MTRRFGSFLSRPTPRSPRRQAAALASAFAPGSAWALFCSGSGSGSGSARSARSLLRLGSWPPLPLTSTTLRPSRCGRRRPSTSGIGIGLPACLPAVERFARWRAPSASPGCGVLPPPPPPPPLLLLLGLPSAARAFCRRSSPWRGRPTLHLPAATAARMIARPSGDPRTGGRLPWRAAADCPAPPPPPPASGGCASVARARRPSVCPGLT